MRYTIFAVLLACVCALCGSLVARAEGPGAAPETTTTSTTTQDDAGAEADPKPTHAEVQRAIDKYRHATWHWQRVMGEPVTLTLHHSPTDPLERIATWKRIAASTLRLAQHPPHARAWECIHHYEGAWTDAYAPYYGGLQMDLGFQRTYGGYLLARKGTANRWTPLEQMWVAERALRAGRGFYPWPNTARYCGLL